MNTLSLKIICIALTLGISSPAMSVDFDSGVFEFQQKMANKGNAQAQYRLGVLYETGKGTKTSYDDALAWYKKAAAQKYKPAELRITYLDIKKTGYKKAEHASWLKELQSEAKDSGELMMLLASMHEKGFIVKKDLKKTQSLLKQATFKNIPGSEAELERIDALVESEKAKEAEEAKRRKAEQEKQRKAEEARKAKEKKAREAKAKQDAQARKQSEAIQKKKQLEAEKRRIAAERRKLEEQQRLLEEQQRKAKAAEKKSTSGSATDPCKGPKARFMTMCK